MAVKNTAQVVIGGKIITLGGYESEEYFQKVASYINNKIATITKKDNDAILKIIKKYYAFEETKEANITIRKQKTIYNKSKENREKVLT